MKNIKNGGKRLLAMVLSLVMCFGLLQVTAFAANWNPGDEITINVRVFDQSTGKTYNVGTDSVEKGNPELIQSVKYQIPQLTSFVKSSQFGRVIKVAGNWYFPSGDSQPGANVEWSCNANKVTMTYWVDWFSAGSGTGGNTSDTVDLGGGGRYTFNFTVRYHSNYPSGTNYTVTKKYTVKNYVATYNFLSSYYPSYSDCNFGGFTPKSNEKTWYTNSACTSVAGTISVTSGATYDLYAGWEAAPTPVETLTLTYKDGNKTYRTLSGFSSGDDVLLMGSPEDKTGYTFEGWSETSGATTAEYKGGAIFTITKNTVLYAVWKENAPAHTVQQNGSGSLNVVKTFSGATKPDAFAMTYQITNGATSGTVGSGTLVFNEIIPGTGIYMATVSYPVWSFAGEWTDAEKAQYDSVITMTEVGADVPNMDLTITATAGQVDNAAKTITHTVGAQVSAAGNLNVTNTYTPSTVTTTPELTGFTKARLTTVPAELNLANINTSDPVNLKVNEEATLLYAITVTGTEGAGYKVTDDGTTWVGGADLEGEIGTSGKAIIYVTKSITIDNIVEGYVENTAHIQANTGTDLGDTVPDTTVYTRANGLMVVHKQPDLHEESRTVDYKVEVTNKVGATLSAVQLVDTMPDSLSISVDSEGNPVYTITVYGADGIGKDVTSFTTAEVEGQVTTWTINDTIEPDAKIVLTYRCSISDDANEGDVEKNVVDVNFRRATVSAAGYATFEANPTVWEYGGTASCDIIVPKALS